MNIRTFVITCNKYAWCLRPFSHLYNKYHGGEVVYCTDKKPDFDMPGNFTYFKAGKDYEKDEWSNSLIKLLEDTEDEFVLLLLEDYWLVRKVDVNAVQLLVEYMKDNRDVLRFDLTDDRQYNGNSVDVGYIHEYDVVQTPYQSEYNMSLQAGIWNTELLHSLLEENKSAWEVEIHTTTPEEMRILGTRQRPVNYCNALLKGHFDKIQFEKLRPEDREIVKKWIPQEYLQKKS